jgi:hypothetical protein
VPTFVLQLLRKGFARLVRRGNEAIKPNRIDYRAGENMGADLRTFFDDDDRLVWRDLFEPDSGAESNSIASRGGSVFMAFT